MVEANRLRARSIVAGSFFAPIAMPNYHKGVAGEYLPDLLAQEAVEFLYRLPPPGAR